MRKTLMECKPYPLAPEVLAELETFLAKTALPNKADFIKIANGKVTFINYVGVVQLSKVRLEILPKIDLSQKTGEEKAGETRVVLHRMFFKSQSAHMHYQLTQTEEPKDLLELLYYLFAKELYQAEQSGLYREYITVQEHTTALQGRLLVAPHFRENMASDTQFRRPYLYCEHEMLSEDNLLNRLFKQCIKRGLRSAKEAHTKALLRKMDPLFDSVSEQELSKEQVKAVANKYAGNRLLHPHVQKALDIAKIVLENCGTASILIDMSDVFEKYVANLIKEHQAALDLQTVALQAKTPFCGTYIQPDIVVQKKGADRPMVIDTKWKGNRQEASPYQANDLYQITTYRTVLQATEGILLYPRNKGMQDRTFDPVGKQGVISLKQIDLTTEKTAVDTLKQLLNRSKKA